MHSIIVIYHPQRCSKSIEKSAQSTHSISGTLTLRKCEVEILVSDVNNHNDFVSIRNVHNTEQVLKDQ